MKNVIRKIIVLVLIFAMVIGIFIFVNRDKEQPDNIIMGEPTLPTITFMAAGASQQDSEVEVNELFGYTTEMETKYMRDTITPIHDDRQLMLRVKNNRNVVMAAEFEVRSLDCERLIEKTEIAQEDIMADGDYTNISIQLDNMINADTEYYLMVKLITDRHEQIYYYTRIINLTNNYCSEQIEFARRFSNATFDSSESESIIGYLEPNASEDNSDFGVVNIHSSFSQITWGNLAPEKVTEPVVKVVEILGDVGCYELVYKVKAVNDYDVYQYYTVTEYFRIKWTSSEIYLLDYQRRMNQIFDASNQNISAYRINLGICQDDKIEFKSSENNCYIAFVKGNGLWLMDINKNRVYSLFAFEEVDNDDIRDANTDNGFQVVSVDDNGNTEFIVYGYMNRGEHEGMVGVSLYRYNMEDNIVEEKIFIPFTRQFEILNETMGRLSYVNDKNVMYVMLSDSVYSVDLSGSEYVQIISNLTEGDYSVNKSGNMIAWEVDSNGGGSSTIKMLDFETGVEQEIVAEQGQKLNIVGFVDNDLAYGIANEQDVVADKNGNVTVAMHHVLIVDNEGKELKNYSKEGYYVYDAEITDNMINLNRLMKSEDGVSFVKAPDYQIFGNEEEETGVVTLDIITTDKKKKEKVITFVKKVTSSDKLKNLKPKEIRFSETNSLSIRELISEDEKFYVYGQGQIQKITDSVSDAITLADNVAGVVINEKGDYTWARISKPNEFSLGNVTVQGNAVEGDGISELSCCLGGMLMHNGVNLNVSEQLAAGKSTIQIINENIKDKQGIDLTGCSFSQVLYYVCKGQPVLAELDGNNYLLIVGYDFYNAILLDPVTGERYKKGQDETGEMFASSGNKFIVIN